MTLKDKNILLGVAGGIAAYKVVQVARDLTVAGAKVHVLMTPGATRFITPLTFQSLTRYPVHTGVWESWTQEAQGHISLAREADLALIAPATADILARLAVGLADDILTTTMLGLPHGVPVLLAPAMETHMYEHPATQQNLKTLALRGAQLIAPGYGKLASGAVGTGRMAEPAQLVAAVRLAFGRLEGDLRGKRLVITAGGTQEDIDPVRYIGNRSSGRMGYAVAAEAARRGAVVTLVTGPTKLADPSVHEIVKVRRAAEMHQAVMSRVDDMQVAIMAAAVADYAPADRAEQKLPKGAESLTLVLKKTPDILGELGQRRLAKGGGPLLA